MCQVIGKASSVLFLRIDDNKTELFQLLAEQTACIEVDGKEVYSTYGEQVLSSPERRDKSEIEPYTHEEADTRLVLHVSEAHQKVMARTLDTDVVVIVVSKLQTMLVNEVWIAFGAGKQFRYIAAHDISQQLGPCNSRALPVFHAFTGCDMVSFFADTDKKTAWDTWSVFP